MSLSEIDPTVPPSGEGCADCDAVGGWWVHLRRCAMCGDVRCCDTSPAQHATAHFRATGHRYVRSFEPGEEWFWDYVAGDYVEGPRSHRQSHARRRSRRRGRKAGFRPTGAN
jgi:hypothetical protein